MELQLKHLAPYLPYRLKYYPSEKSDLFHDLYADYSQSYSCDYTLALEANDEYALKIKNSFLVQNEIFISVENNEIFLGQFKSSLGYDVDDVYLSEVKPILRSMSDLTSQELEAAGFEDYIDWLTNEFSHWVGLYGLKETINETPYGHIQYLMSQHYDLFGLIPAGLAININSLDHATNP